MPVTIEFDAVLLDVINTVVCVACDGDERATNGKKRRILGVRDLCRKTSTPTGSSDFDVLCYV